MNTQQQQPHHSESLINTCGFVYSLHGEGVRWVHAMLVRHCGKYSFSWGFAKLRDTRIYNIIFVYLGAHIRHTFQIVWLAGNEKKKMTFIWIWAQRSCAFCCACHKLWYDFLLFWIDRSNNAVSCDTKVSLHCIEIYEIYWHFDDVSLFRNWAIKCTTHLLELLMQKCSYILIKHKASPTQSVKKT